VQTLYNKGHSTETSKAMEDGMDMEHVIVREGIL